MHSIVKRLKNDLGDAHLHFAVAKADSVNALERYRGKCRPCYLIYAGCFLFLVYLSFRFSQKKRLKEVGEKKERKRKRRKKKEKRKQKRIKKQETKKKKKIERKRKKVKK